MAHAKKEEFDDRTNQLAAFARALAHPARIAILRTLAERNSCLCGEIVEGLPLAQSTVSEHLRILREARVLGARREGAWIWYCLCHETLARFAREVGELARVPQDAGTG